MRQCWWKVEKELFAFHLIIVFNRWRHLFNVDVKTIGTGKQCLVSHTGLVIHETCVDFLLFRVSSMCCFARLTCVLFNTRFYEILCFVLLKIFLFTIHGKLDIVDGPWFHEYRKSWGYRYMLFTLFRYVLSLISRNYNINLIVIIIVYFYVCFMCCPSTTNNN